MRTIIDNAGSALREGMERADHRTFFGTSLSGAQKEEYHSWLHDL